MSNQQVYSPTGYRSYYYQLCTLTGDLEGTNNAILTIPVSDDCDFVDLSPVSVSWDENGILTWFKTDGQQTKTLHPYAIKLLNIAGIIVPERFIDAKEHGSKNGLENDNGGTWFTLFMFTLTIVFLSYFQVAQFDKSNPFLVTVFFLPVASFWIAKFSI